MTAQDHTPDSLGPYRLIERLGEGGMGVVYLASAPDQRRVAVKALRPAIAADPNARRRLAREVETMRRVRSPFVAEVIDADVTCDTPYIVTRYVNGPTLERVVTEEGPLTGEKLSRLASGLALALAAVHGAGVVHRDLKPGNVMISHGEPVVIDFGIAQAAEATRLTQTGMFMGTPGYLAPEVIEGGNSGPASDVHSWGATVAFAATGRAPYGTGAFETIFYRIINGQPDLGGFPVPLLDLVTRALSRDPARRPTAADLCLRTASLDPSSLVAAPAATAAPLAAAGAAGAIADRPIPGTLPGAGPAIPAPAGLAGLPATLRSPAPPPGRNGGGPQGYGDLLPPVQYAPGAPAQYAPGAPVPPQAPARNGTPARAAGRSPAGPLLVAGCVVAAVAAAVAFPVAGTVAALAMLIGLRAAGRTAGRLSAQRTRRGARVSDPLVAAFVFPASLAWSVIRSLLLAPLALATALLAAVITVALVPRHPIGAAFAFGAGALVAFYCVGPGSGGSRQPMRKLFDAVAGTSAGSAVALAAVAAMVVAVISVTATHAPFFWPAGHLAAWVQHFHLISRLEQTIRTRALRLVGRTVPAGP
jgi:predicted Ser/Thr protein kinase